MVTDCLVCYLFEIVEDSHIFCVFGDEQMLALLEGLDPVLEGSSSENFNIFLDDRSCHGLRRDCVLSIWAGR